MVTISEISEKLDVGKQTIRRYIKDEMHIQSEPGKTLRLTDEQAAQIAHHFTTEKPKTRKTEQIKTGNNRVDLLNKEIQTLKDSLQDLEKENIRLQSRYEAEIFKVQTLQEENKKLHKIIEREQENHKPLWARIFSKRLPEPKE